MVRNQREKYDNNLKLVRLLALVFRASDKPVWTGVLSCMQEFHDLILQF